MGQIRLLDVAARVGAAALGIVAYRKVGELQRFVTAMPPRIDIKADEQLGHCRGAGLVVAFLLWWAISFVGAGTRWVRWRSLSGWLRWDDAGCCGSHTSTPTQPQLHAPTKHDRVGGWGVGNARV